MRALTASMCAAAWCASSVALAQPAAPKAPAAPQPTAAPTATGVDGAPPPTQEAPTPTEPSEVAAEACVPSCRATYQCVRGECVSNCNPPCEEGLVCTAEATCVPRQPLAAPVPSSAPASSAPAPQVAVPVEDTRAWAEWRRAHRFDHHLTVDGSGRGAVLLLDGRDDDPVDADGAGSGYGVLSIGYMHNVAENFGMALRLNFGGGGVGLGSERELADGTTLRGGEASRAGLVEVEVMPYGGPFGPFYIGPLGFVGYRWYEKGVLRAEDGNVTLRTLRLNDEVVAGAGLGMGVFLGRKHDMHLSWSFRSSFTDRLPFEAQLGFGYRFGHLWSSAGR